MSSCKVPKCLYFLEFHLGCLLTQLLSHLKPCELHSGVTLGALLTIWEQECVENMGNIAQNVHCGTGTSVSLRGHISLVQGRNLPASLWAPVQGGGKRKNTFYSGKVLDQSIPAEVLMHGCFLSLRLTQCRSLPSQASIEALLINLLKCRFSNIIMTEHCCLLLGKQN